MALSIKGLGRNSSDRTLTKLILLGFLVALPLASTGSVARESGKTSAAKAADDKPADTVPAVAAPVVPAQPRQTMATFGDWIVRCERTGQDMPGERGSKHVCEASQALVVKGQQAPVALIAFSYPPTDKTSTKVAGESALKLTVALPLNISFDKSPLLSGSDDRNSAKLTFKRCLPGGCIAEAPLPAEMLKDLRTTGKPGHLTFSDAAERTVTLPLSFRGLAQALDDLAREAG